VLTGGASRRMGRTKALIEIDGVPMAARAAAALRSAGCARVVAYGGDPVELAPIGVPVLPDRYPGCGPLGGVLGLLESYAETGDDVSVLVVACDLPALTGDHLVDLVDAARARPDADVVVARTSAIEPVCAVWRPSATERLRRLFDAGERALHTAIAHLERVEVDVEPAALRNINTPAELGRYP